MRIRGFIWDDINRDKVREHGLEPDDVEEVVEASDSYVFEHPDHPGRHIALGFTADGRFTLVSLEHSPRTNWVRVVTAYEPTGKEWWTTYAKAKGLKP